MGDLVASLDDLVQAGGQRTGMRRGVLGDVFTEPGCYLAPQVAVPDVFHRVGQVARALQRSPPQIVVDGLGDDLGHGQLSELDAHRLAHRHPQATEPRGQRTGDPLGDHRDASADFLLRPGIQCADRLEPCASVEISDVQQADLQRLETPAALHDAARRLDVRRERRERSIRYPCNPHHAASSQPQPTVRNASSLP
jgi:hypothetical protein